MAETPNIDGSGTGTGPSTPQPDIDYEPIEIDVDSVASLGQALALQADNVGTAHGEIKPQLNAIGTGERGTKEVDYPIGGGHPDLTITDLVSTNASRMGEITDFLTQVEIGLRNLGNLSAGLAASFGNQDALNATSVDQIRSFITGSESGSTEV